MPYRWSDETEPAARVLTAWPHRSLPRRGFAAFILGTWAMLMLPAVAVLGTAALWGLLPFLVAAIGLTWFFLERSYRSGELTEVLRLTADAADLVRRAPGQAEQRWQANPYWVAVGMRATGGPVKNYLTLKGGGRIVEFGAYLSPDERRALYSDLQDEFAALRGAVRPAVP